MDKVKERMVSYTHELITEEIYTYIIKNLILYKENLKEKKQKR